jgi:hypothetical protein
MDETRSNYDGAWKEALEGYFAELMAFFFPQAYAEIDWSRGHKLLDKELMQVTPAARLGPRREEIEEGFGREIQAYEEERQMPYITSVERIGIKKGFEQGIQQGEALVLKRLLARRFGTLPPWVEERLIQADQETLERWAERLLEAVTIKAVFEES